MERWGIIYSPKSGVFRTHKRWEQIRRCLQERGVEYDFVQSEGHGSEERLAAMLAKNGYSTLIVVGGDGALNRALNGVMSVSPTLLQTMRFGIIPNGRGNDFANYWGFEEDNPVQTIDWLIKGRVRKVDLGVLKTSTTQRYFLNSVNLGLVAYITDLKHKTYRFWGMSSLSFLSSFFVMLFHRMECKMKLVVNGETIDRRLMTVCIGNAKGYGQTPNAVPYNGMLDVSVVSHPAVAQLVEGMMMLVHGKFLSHKSVTPYRTRQRIEVLHTGGTKVSMDGQVWEGADAPLQVFVEQEQVNFIIPT